MTIKASANVADQNRMTGQRTFHVAVRWIFVDYSFVLNRETGRPGLRLFFKRLKKKRWR